MKRLWERVLGRLNRLLDGRYGCDGLSVLYLCIAIMMAVCAYGSPTGTLRTFLYVAAFLLAGYGIYRCFSKDLTTQKKQWEALENELAEIDYQISLHMGVWKIKRGYRYFRCKQCGHRYRVRKIKGKRAAICPNCGSQRFNKKTG